MDNEDTFQERFLLTLDSDPTSNLIRSMLKSPLGLSHKIVRCLFNDNFDEIRENLDSIKEFVAGVTRAEKFGNHYLLAKFYPPLFAFHQFFHSSYRARQGKTLEECIKELLRETNSSLIVPDKLNNKIKVMGSVFKGYNSKRDLDVVAQNKSKVMAIQLRSNVDTGGTTAKSSLVEVFGKILTLPKILNKSLFYHIGVWETEGNQKTITKDKFYDLLEHHLRKLKIDRNKFLSNIEKGITIKKDVSLKLSFGTKEILRSIKEWLGNPVNLKDSAINDMTKKMENWDDLWLSYAIASIEMQTKKFKGYNNVEYLDKLLKDIRYDTSKYTKSIEYVKLADELALKIIPMWEQPSIPLDSPSDKVHYIRDLILLKFIFLEL
jgi:hypothetical protein